MVAGSKRLGFALMMSVPNLSIFGSAAIGPQPMGAHHRHFCAMMLMQRPSLLLAVPSIFRQPATIVDRKDGEEKTAVQLPRLGSVVLRE